MNPWLVRTLLYPIHQAKSGRRTLWWYRRLSSSDRWEEPRLRKWQQEKLQQLLLYAAGRVPYYRTRIPDRCLAVEGASFWAQWQEIPPLSKEAARSHWRELLAVDYPGDFLEIQTSGSTGRPVVWRVSRKAQDVHKAVKVRGLRWWGFRVGDPNVWLWGRDEIQGLRQRFRHLLVENKRILNLLELSEKTAGNFYWKMIRAKPVYLYGYPSGFVQFARLCERQGLPLDRIGVQGVVTAAEVLTPAHRQYIAQSFGCPVVNEYGCSEAQAIAMECPKGGMHVNADALLVEVLRDGLPAAPGEMGEVVVTDLFNEAMPLIRYRIGDLGTLRKEHCPCGRTLPLMELQVGRELEMIRLPGGGLMHPEIFTPAHGSPLFERVERFRVIQKNLASFRVQVVTSAEDFDLVCRSFIQHIRGQLGDQCKVEIERVAEIPRDPSGKLRYFVSEVSRVSHDA